MFSVCVIITTFNRQKNVLHNLNVLSQCKSYIRHVYVIDNASNLPKSLNNNFISIIHNKNLGGSGGYARGMYEAQKDKNVTHIMFMDDDISFDPKTLEEAVKKINNKDWVSFAMRTFEEPNKIYENTAYWTGIRIKSNFRGQSVNKEGITQKNVIYNYAGWWSLIMPISVISNYGYPMPYFIKSDDIEYGLRRNDEKIIYDNNLSILHESFDKKYSDYINYYNVRNHIITDMLHFKHSLIDSLLVFILRSGKAWLTGKYQILELYLIGMRDILKGPDFFKKVDIESNNQNIKKVASQIKFNFFRFILQPFLVLFYSIKFSFKHHKLKVRFLGDFKYLTSKEYWEKQFFN